MTEPIVLEVRTRTIQLYAGKLCNDHIGWCVSMNGDLLGVLTSVVHTDGFSQFSYRWHNDESGFPTVTSLRLPFDQVIEMEVKLDGIE